VVRCLTQPSDGFNYNCTCFATKLADRTAKTLAGQLRHRRIGHADACPSPKSVVATMRYSRQLSVGRSFGERHGRSQSDTAQTWLGQVLSTGARLNRTRGQKPIDRGCGQQKRSSERAVGYANVIRLWKSCLDPIFSALALVLRQSFWREVHGGNNVTGPR
jgi:hypothetical protein